MYSLQIYFDFSGYSDMAIGVARMLGLDLPINFNSPYKANSISDFWDRWHITLTWFLTHYIYIPLGGNRKGRIRTYINIMIVFLISGFWHGASYTFIAWGLLHGFATVIHRMGKTHIKLPVVAGRVITLAFVNFAWILFRVGSFGTLRNLVSACMNGGWGSLSQEMCKASLPRIISMLMSDGASYTIPACMFVVIVFIFTQTMKNSQGIVAKNKYTILDATAIILMSTTSLLSLTGVAHFIYAYF